MYIEKHRGSHISTRLNGTNMHRIEVNFADFIRYGKQRFHISTEQEFPFLQSPGNIVYFKILEVVVAVFFLQNLKHVGLQFGFKHGEWVIFVL